MTLINLASKSYRLIHELKRKSFRYEHGGILLCQNFSSHSSCNHKEVTIKIMHRHSICRSIVDSCNLHIQKTEVRASIRSWGQEEDKMEKGKIRHMGHIKRAQKQKISKCPTKISFLKVRASLEVQKLYFYSE